MYKETSDGNVQQSIKLRLLTDFYKGQKSESEKIMSIISVKLSNFKYKIFSQNGILMNQVNFPKQVQRYGTPIAVSPDGLNYLFKKTDEDMDIRYNQGKLKEEELVELYFKFSVVCLTVFGMCHIKDIDLL